MGYIAGFLKGAGKGMADYGEFKMKEDAAHEAAQARFTHDEAMADTRYNRDVGMADTAAGRALSLQESANTSAEKRERMGNQSAEKIANIRASDDTDFSKKFKSSPYADPITFYFGESFGKGKEQAAFHSIMSDLTSSGMPESIARNYALEGATGRTDLKDRLTMLSQDPRFGINVMKGGAEYLSEALGPFEKVTAAGKNSAIEKAKQDYPEFFGKKTTSRLGPTKENAKNQAASYVEKGGGATFLGYEE